MTLDAVVAAGTTGLTVINSFTGRWSFLSNFHPSPVPGSQIVYPTAEHAFNAGKTLDEKLRRWIAAAGTPGEAKRRGRSVPLRPDWDDKVRYEVMAAVLRAKFADPAMGAALATTGTARLVEGNRHHDQHWGTCFCARPACARPGENHLGRLLVQVRAELGGRP